MKVYLAGPMSTEPEHLNQFMFEAGAKKLRALGHEVFSPWEADVEEFGTLDNIKANADYRKCLQKDLEWIMWHAEAICMLPGWQRSKGARTELTLAEALRLRVWYMDDVMNVLENYTKEVQQTVEP